MTTTRMPRGLVHALNVAHRPVVFAEVAARIALAFGAEEVAALQLGESVFEHVGNSLSVAFIVLRERFETVQDFDHATLFDRQIHTTYLRFVYRNRLFVCSC